MEKKSPRILSKLSSKSKSSSSKSSTLSKDFKNKNNSTDDKTTTKQSDKVSLSFKELKKQQDKQLKLQQQQYKLKQKQLKLEQKKLEKEQKQNTLKSTKNKTTIDQTITEQPILVDDEKRFSDGIKFKGKLVGIEPVMSARGDKICQDALKNLKLRRTSSHKKRIILNINLNGVQLLDQKTNELVANHVINLISYITRDISDNRTFGYVYGTPDIGHQFIAIKSEKDSAMVMNAIGELFTYVYNKKKKEKQELEQRQNQFQDQSIAENSQSSHTIIDNQQPQNQGFDNETLMEFLKQQQDKINNQQSTSSTLPTTTATMQDDFNRSTSKGFDDFNSEKEDRYLSQQSNKFNTLPISTRNTLPPPLPPRLESGQSNYSSNSNLNSFSTYSQSNFDTSTNFQSTSNNYQSNLSLATTHNSQYEPCSDLQQMQNVISSARKANDKFKNWHQFDEDNNNVHDDFGSNSLISERDEDENESMDDDNWANFNDLPEPPPDLPPPLYQSNEDLSITTTSADTYTLTNQHQQPDFNNQFSNEQFNISSNQLMNKQPQPISDILNSSQNSTTTAFAVPRLDTPPSSNRRRRSTRLSESSSIIVENSNNKDKHKFDDSNETTRRQNVPLNTNNQFETNFNQQSSDEFFDFDKLNNPNDDNNKNFNLQKTQSFLSKESNRSIDLNREDSSSRNDSRNDSRISNYNSNQFNNSFDSQFDNQQNDNKIFVDSFSQSMQINNSLNNENSSASFNRERKKSIDNTQQQLKLTNKRLSLNELISKRDPNDKYAVFNEINSMKFSIFSNDGTLIEKNEDDQVFFTTNNNQSLNATNLEVNNKNFQLINNSDNNKLQNFEDSFLSTGNNSLNQSKNSSFYSASINKSTQLNQSSNLNNNKESISSNNSIYSSITADPELIECHKKFLRERQEKLDQIDKIFEEEKQKIRSRQKELNQEHLKQQKKLLNQQKTYQQEFYQRQKHQRQTILHQLQLQRLPVQQFDQCKLQLQQRLKNDQKILQQEFIKKQQELKKQQIEEQNQLIKQYKTLEEQYLEKQSELLNSDFEIELDLPEVPNIFDDSQLLDDNLQTDEQALTKKFELSLKNEFDKLNEIVQTTESSLNSSPKFHQERCSTACSIASSNNPFINDDKFSFEDFDRALNLLDNKIEWKGSGQSSLEYSLPSGGGRQYDLDFYMFNNNESKDNSLEYGFANNNNINRLTNERISSASSLDMNRSTSTLPNTFTNKIIDNTLNKSLNNEPFTNKFTTSGIELKKPQFNLNNSFRSQQQLTTNSLSNSLPKNLDNSNSLNNLGANNNFQSSSNFSSSNYPLNQSLSHQKSAFKQPYSLPQNQNDPFDTLKFDNKLNEINRIKQLRQETQQQLVSLALPSSIDTMSTNRSSNQESNKNQFTKSNQVKLEPLEEKKSITNTSIKELEDLLGLSTSTLNKNTNNNKLFDNLLDLKKTNNLVNFTSTTKSNNEQFNQTQPKTNSQINLFANDNFKVKNNSSSLSFQDLRSDTRTDQFLNSLQKNTQNLLPLQQKNSLDVFGTVVIDDLNNKSTAKQLFNHFGDKEEPNIFNMKGDPFKDDFFNS